jgi:ketosteroid isomerase-like protein
MTTQDNIQTVQKAYADFGRGDIASILDALDESIEWITPGEGAVATAGKRRGKAEVAEFFRIVAESWDFDSFEPLEFLAQGDTVVVIGRYSMVALAANRNVASDWVMVWRLRDGKVTHFQEYTDTLTLSCALAAETAA